MQRRLPQVLRTPLCSADSSESGQVIVESLVAMSIIVGSLMGMLYLSRTAIGLHREIADRIIATNLAAEGVEIVKNTIDNSVLTCDVGGGGVSEVNWTLACEEWDAEFPQSDPTFGVSYEANRRLDEKKLLEFDASTGRYGYAVPYGATHRRPGSRSFTRAVSVRKVSETRLRVSSLVTWEARGGEERVELKTDFYDWRQK